jgi:RecB family exonuclease
MERVFLGWRQPPLRVATRWLIERFGRGGSCDLSPAIVVVPTGRAARRLLELLVLEAEQAGRALRPPTIVTPEVFPELLYPTKRPLADALTQQLAWANALQQADPEERSAFLPHPPDEEDLPRWLAAAESLRRLHLELAADGLSFSQVVARAGDLEGFAEHSRWQALCRLQRRYLDLLDALGQWDVQTARLVAIQRREIATDRHVVLLGTVDLNLAHRQMLEQIADRVTALVAAPPELAERFDPLGCLRPQAWRHARLDLADEQIERVDGPAEQAEAAVAWLASLEGAYRAEEIVLSLPDHALAPHLERYLTLAGLRSHDALGRTVGQSGPFRLLEAVARYASTWRFEDLAALVRHPDLQDWLLAELRRQGHQVFDLITALDRFASQRLPARLHPDQLAADDPAADVRTLLATLKPLVNLLAGRPRPVGRWAEPLRQVLAEVYGRWEVDRDTAAGAVLWQSLSALRQALDDVASVPQALQGNVEALAACHLALTQVAGSAITLPRDPEAIEMIGWLDLPLDDAPAALVTTFNEGWIPSSATADVFLPNRLRELLGLVHNDRRLARDAYAASLVTASRPAVRWIVARHDTQGNPLAPSRLLFLADDATAFRRAAQMFQAPPARPVRGSWLDASPPPKESALGVPRPLPLAEPITELRVTQFRDYLACPYRFYLRHLKRLRRLDDRAAELDGAQFGDLAHAVLQQFGRSDEAQALRQSDNPHQIARFLKTQLEKLAAARYGPRWVRPAVQVQWEQLRLRLEAFAQWQAQRAGEGWQIVYGEDAQADTSLATTLMVDDQPFTIRGRMDRVDYHPRQRVLCVLDYKTSDAGAKPQQTHRRRGRWVDLQLPLYRHLVAVLPDRPQPIEQVALGYVLLPVDPQEVGLAQADWSEEELAEADALAEDVIRRVRAEEFWPPASPPPAYADDLAVICQDHRLGGWHAEDDAA